MPQGTVKWFNDRKGFGFISPNDSSEDVFVHHSDIVADGYRTLVEGQEVTFELEDGKRGLRAVNVSRV
jgi:CspA family cold shock protein